MIRILIVDDLNLVRCALGNMLAAEPDLQVVGQLGSGEAALQFVARQAVDVVLLDVSMPGLGGIETTKRLRRVKPALRIVGLSAHTHPIYPRLLFKFGAVGYLPKTAPPGELLAAIRVVHGGQKYLPVELAKTLAQIMVEEPTDAQLKILAGLNEQEWQILLMASEGLQTPEIANNLCLAPKTITTYRRRLLRRLGLESEVALTLLALREKLIEQVG